MAITFVAAGTEGSGVGSSVTLGWPAGMAANDVAIALWHISAVAVTGTMSSDWTVIAQHSGGGTTSRLAAWWHRYNGATTPSLVVSATGGATPIGGIAAFRGCNTLVSPINVAGNPGSGGAVVDIIHPSITPTVSSCMLLLCNGAADDNNRTLLSPFTNVFEDTGGGTDNAFLSTAGNPDGSVSMFYKIHGSGPTEVFSVAQAAGDAWTAFQIALNPEPPTTVVSAGDTLIFLEVPQKQRWAVNWETIGLPDFTRKTAQKTMADTVQMLDRRNLIRIQVLLDALLLVDAATALYVPPSAPSAPSPTLPNLDYWFTEVDAVNVDLVTLWLYEEFGNSDALVPLTPVPGTITTVSVSDALALIEAQRKDLWAIRVETMALLDFDRKQQFRQLVETLAIPDVVQRIRSHWLTDFSVLGDAAALQRGATVSDTVSLLDRTVKILQRQLAEAAPLLDALRQEVSHRLTDQAGVVDSLAAFVVRLRAVVDLLPLVDSAVATYIQGEAAQIIVRLVTDQATLLDSVLRTALLQLAEAVGIRDDSLRQSFHVLAEAVLLVDALAQTRVALRTDTTDLSDRSLQTRVMLLTDVLSLVDAMAAYRERRAAVADTVAVLDQSLRTAEHRIVEAVGLADNRQAVMTKLLSDTAALVDRIVQERLLRLLDAAPLLDSATTLFVQGANVLERLVVDQAALADLLTESHVRFLRETLGQTDAVVSTRQLRTADAASLIDQLARQVERPLALTDAVPLADRIVQLGQRLVTDLLRAQDAVGLGRLLTISDLTATLADVLVAVRALSRLVEDRAALRVDVGLSFTKVLLEAVGLPDLDRRLRQMVLTDLGLARLLDAAATAITLGFPPIIGFPEDAVTAVRPYFSSILTTNDYFGRRLRPVAWFSPTLTVKKTGGR